MPPKTARASCCAKSRRKWRVIYNDENVGFAAGQNQAITLARGEWVLCLNPDIVLSPDFVTRLVQAGEGHPEAGTICGKLLRWQPSARSIRKRRAMGVPDPEAEMQKTNIIDSTGIYFTPNMRHLDRGAEEIDRGQYDQRAVRLRRERSRGNVPPQVHRRRLGRGTSSSTRNFLPSAKTAISPGAAQVMGWKCLYTPAAVAWHVRRVTPERRKDLPLVINWHSAKNRFLMRGKNASGWLCWRLAIPVAWRDLMTFGYAAVRDRRLWSAVVYWWKERESIRRKRAIIQSRRRVSDRDLLWWFSNRPRAIDVEEQVTSGQLPVARVDHD